MDRIPLINPKLIKVSAADERAPESILRAEVVSSTPSKESTTSQTNNSQQQDYKVVLKIGQQQLNTISNIDLKKGLILDVKLLPGPELKILNGDSKVQHMSPPEASSIKLLTQQLLADRIPNIQQQELPNLIKQLSQIINANSNVQQPTAQAAPNPAMVTENIRHNVDSGTKTTAIQSKQQLLANEAYLHQNKLLNPPTTTNPLRSEPSTALQDARTWLQQLPKENNITNVIGLRNALTNAGPQAEKQLSHLAQQAINITDKKSANNIFQQLQSLQNTTQKDPNTTNTLANKILNNHNQPTTDLPSIIKRTARALASNSQSLLSGITVNKNLHTNISPTASSSTEATNLSSNTNPLAVSNKTATQWQNPLLNNSTFSLDDLLQAPLLQNPSSNNKFALSQILTGHHQQSEENFKIPLNWPERSGNDAALIRNLQNLLGHIEREQIQQMQSSEATQNNNPNQLQQHQQWIPLLINHQQQLQLIEFYIDKEENLDSAGEKKNHWFINLHFNLPNLGELGIEITMIDNECKTTFWSESKSTLHQLTNHIQPLRQRLTEQGIIVTDIQPRHGTLEKRKNNIQQRLVDIKT